MNKTSNFSHDVARAYPQELNAIKNLNIIFGDSNLPDDWEYTPHNKNKSDNKADGYSKTLDMNVEIKCEFYDSPNFFIERYSNDSTKTPGGPWQYVDKAELFLFIFPKLNKIFVFSTEVLLREVEKIIDTNIGFRESWVKNKTYKTYGYVIPRKSLEEFCYIGEII